VYVSTLSKLHARISIYLVDVCAACIDRGSPWGFEVLPRVLRKRLNYAVTTLTTDFYASESVDIFHIFQKIENETGTFHLMTSLKRICATYI